MSKGKLPDHLRKVPLPIRVHPEVAKAARESGNASEWMNEAGKEKLANEMRQRKRKRKSKR